MGCGLGVIHLDEYPPMIGLEICNKLEHYIFRSHTRRVGCQDGQFVLLDGIPYHPLIHLVFRKAMFPFEFVPYKLCKEFKLRLVEEPISPRVGGSENLGEKG